MGNQSASRRTSGRREYGGCDLFRFDPRSREALAAITDLKVPNGLAFSADGRLLLAFRLPEVDANLFFGEPAGRDLYVIATTRLYGRTTGTTAVPRLRATAE